MKIFSGAVVSALLLLASSAFAGPVNINSASAEALLELKGVGESKAAAIVAYREANGAFASVEELTNVKGIGVKTVELNEGEIVLKEKVN